MIDSCRLMIKARQKDDVMQLVRAGDCGAAGLCLLVLHCRSQALGAQRCLHTCSSTGNYRWGQRIALACQCERRHPGRKGVVKICEGSGDRSRNGYHQQSLWNESCEQTKDKAACWLLLGQERKGRTGNWRVGNGENGAHAQDDDQSLFVEWYFKCGIIKSPLFSGCSSHRLTVRRAKWISESIPHGLAA